MNRALWLLGEIVLGLMLAGALTAVAVPALMRRGWDTGPLAGVLALGTGVVLCVAIGERLRKTRRRDRLS
jgi:O-antigen ligase